MSTAILKTVIPGTAMMPFGDRLSVTYFKRFKMEIDLAEAPVVPELPAGYSWVAWNDSLVEAHGEALFSCFQDEIDAIVFPSLGSRLGCCHLMTEISRKPGFLASATWLLRSADGCCGTVQGVRDRTGLGAIQNLGIAPLHRGRGLGRALLLQALEGFRRASLPRAFLEVTAQNEGAVRLYQRVGFRKRKTVYKAVEIVSAALALAPEV